MKVPYEWLKQYVPEMDIKSEELAEKLTLSGSKVELIEKIGENLKNVVVGKIETIEKHPDADKLVVTSVNIGKEENLQIVTAATNISVGNYVPVALDGAVLHDDFKIKKGKLRGVVSEGMFCSVEELGCNLDDFPEAPEDGIYIFQKEETLGADVIELLDLKDEVIEFEITSNRPDCFSVLGLARETAVTLDKPFVTSEIKLNETGEGDVSSMVKVSINNDDLCKRYIAKVVKNVKIEPSPRWLRKRLKSAGLRPINNIVDITNYIMLEYGQPMHAFSIENIEGGEIIVRNAADNEKFTTLDGVERTLDSSMLVIADTKKSLALAGIMGGENSKILENSTTILFECANFDGSSIRVNSKKIGLRTDSSGKFEKGLDPNVCEEAINRACQFVEMFNCGDVLKGSVDCYKEPLKKAEIPYDVEKINKLLGTDISEDGMVKIFTSLEFEVNKAAKMLTIPTFRPDVLLLADIAEEIARFYGYDKIVPTLASGTATVGKKSLPQQITDIVKNTMVASGLYEAMTYSFESPKVYNKLNLPEDSDIRKNITIRNPLGEDYSVMRTTTLDGILSSLMTNFNRRNETAGLFEIGKIYIPKALPVVELPIEETKLTIGLYGNDVDFYSLKGIVEKLLSVLGIDKKCTYARESEISFMHPGRTANVVNSDNNETIGYFGELHPAVCENYEINTKVYVAVLSMDTLIDMANLVSTYVPLPKYPAITRDIAMLIDENVLVLDIENVIKKNGGKLLESVKLFDVYQGSQIEPGFKSVAYSLTFRAADRTLIEDDVVSAVNKILKKLESDLKAVLRDK